MNDSESMNQAGHGAEATTKTPSVGIVENRAAYEVKAQELRDAVARKAAMVGRLETMTRAQHAAQAEAEAVRKQWSTKLRDSDGVLSREIQKLRVAERSALSLVEEYQAMQQEMKPQLASHELSVADLAHQCIAHRNSVVRVAADDAYLDLMAQAGGLIATAYSLYRIANTAEIVMRTRPSDEQLEAAFLAKIGRDLTARMSGVGESVKRAIGTSSLALDGVDMGLVNSPARRSMLVKQASATSI